MHTYEIYETSVENALVWFGQMHPVPDNKHCFNRTDWRKHSLIKIQILFSKNYIYNRHTNKTHGIFGPCDILFSII